MVLPGFIKPELAFGKEVRYMKDADMSKMYGNLYLAAIGGGTTGRPTRCRQRCYNDLDDCLDDCDN
jgi:hypothetical protein